MGSRKVLTKTKLLFIENIVIIEKITKMLLHQFLRLFFNTFSIIKKWDDSSGNPIWSLFYIVVLS